MKLHDLPDDVLRLILEASLKSSGSISAKLKFNLPVVAVCRRWRRLALPIVHSKVVIHYGKPNRRRGSEDDLANNAANGPDDAKITTNLGLVVPAGCVQTVKRVEVGVKCNSPLFGLGKVIRLMRAAAEEWKGVRHFCISVSSDGLAPDLGDSVAGYEAGIKQTSAALAAIMPGVLRVSFLSKSANSVSRELGGQLAVLYSDRLEVVYSYHPITVPPDHTFKQLTVASIQHDKSISYQHPRVDPARLVTLNLELWPSNHSWAPFSPDGDSEEITFPNLKYLAVKYQPANGANGADVRHRGDHPWKLHFPKLKVLDVGCKQNRCPLLEYAVLPPRMDKFFIEAAAPVIVRAAEMRVPTSRHLVVSIGNNGNGNPAALTAANRILEGARESKEALLDVNDGLIPVLPESITCTWLTALLIRANTSVDAMLRFIRMLPRLTSLNIRRLELGDIQEDISIPGSDESRLAEPLGTKLARLDTGINLNEPAMEMAVSVTKYLLLRIPTLVRLCSLHLPSRPIAEFVDAYSGLYPHLTKVEYLLDDASHWSAIN